MSLRFRLNPSFTLLAAYCTVHLAAVVAVAVSAFPVPLQISMILVLGTHTLLLGRRAILATRPVLVAVEFDDSDTLIELDNGRRVPVAVTDVYCTSWLQVVRFRRMTTNAGETFWLIVLPDSADADTRRQLRACLLALPLQGSVVTS